MTPPTEATGHAENPGAQGLDLTPAPAATSATARVVAQARFDATVMLRNGEQLLLTLVLPALLLVALSHISYPNLGTLPHGRRVDVIAPGILALAIISAAFTGQAIATGFDRRHGVLRFLGTTPLGRDGLAAGRVLAVLVVEMVQIVILSIGALAIGWRPAASGLFWAALFVVTGTAAFVALGLLLAGTLRSEAVLAVANLVWVLLVAAGGVVVPSGDLGGGVWTQVARLLPSGALGDGMRAALVNGTLDVRALVVLLIWTVVATLGVRRWFRWD